ncbi:carbohydrate kinase family protein [Paenibacillus sp. NPDC058071]|uniref:carbohydrate kinase family protein n=1 Tax=Paenibacillus sp. NPDC058071 TaxID=3346326 RepID=UPI0036DE6496
MERYDVLICGPIFTDLIFTDVSRMPSPGEEVFSQGFDIACGGSAYITAVSLARLGIKAGVLAPLGDDIFGGFAKEQLHREGLTTSLIYPAGESFRQVSAAVNCAGDRAFITYQDPLENNGYIAHVLEVLDRVETEMLIVNARPEFASVIRKAHDKGMTLVLDLGWDDEWIYSEELKELLRMGDWFTPNLPEALAISGKDQPEEALQMLSGLVTTPIIKLGKDGAMYKADDGIRYVPGAPIDNPVDTTGAGDNFLGGLLAGILKGWSLTDAIRLGNYCGAQSVQGIGGNANSPAWEQVESEFQLNNHHKTLGRKQ